MYSKGVYLTGVNSYIELMNSNNLNFKELTVFFRFRMNKTSSLKYLLSKSTSGALTTGLTGWRFNYNINRYELNFDLSESSTNYLRLTINFNIFDNQLHEVIGRWDGVLAYLWIDRKAPVGGAFIGNMSNSLPIVIGASGDYLYSSQCIFDELLIWNRALTDAEISKLQNGNIPQNGLVIHMTFNEGIGVVTKDVVSGLHGKMVNCRWVNQQIRGMYFDNGGLNFTSNLNFSYNYCSIITVFKMNALARGGNPAKGRCCVVHPGGDKCMIWNDVGDAYLRTTNYDGIWKAVATDDFEPMHIYVAVGVWNNNEEHLYLASNGVIVDHVYRLDLGDCGDAVDKAIQVGSTAIGSYKHHGEILASFVYNRPVTEDEIKYISDGGWVDPPRDGLISWVLFDGLKEGETPKDLINNVEGVNIGTPRPVIRKPVR